nr:MAG TPA: hypothetical protein [Bacteriophage sp.]
MIERNTKVSIVSSPKLTEMMLEELAGKTGIVTENLAGSERLTKGYMVFLQEPYEDEYEWFIPVESIRRA